MVVAERDASRRGLILFYCIITYGKPKQLTGALDMSLKERENVPSPKERSSHHFFMPAWMRRNAIRL